MNDVDSSDDTCRAPARAEIARKFAALAHPARIEILARVASFGVCSCRDVVDGLDLAQSTVSQHLKVLVEAGLLTYAAERQCSRYRVDQASMQQLSMQFSGYATACCRPLAKAD